MPLESDPIGEARRNWEAHGWPASGAMVAATSIVRAQQLVVARIDAALAPFNLTILPIKAGKKVTRLRIGWWNKNKDEINAAWQELHRSKVGRRARISGQIEYVHEALPSENRLLRQYRIANAKDGEDL